MDDFLNKEELDYLIFIGTNVLCVCYNSTDEKPVFRSEYIKLDILNKLVKLDFVRIIKPQFPDYENQVQLKVTIDGRWKLSTACNRDKRFKEAFNPEMIKNII